MITFTLPLLYIPGYKQNITIIQQLNIHSITQIWTRYKLHDIINIQSLYFFTDISFNFQNKVKLSIRVLIFFALNNYF